MKKLMVLMLVLGLASIAQATPMIHLTATGAVGDNLVVTPGQSITIQVIANETIYGFEMTAVEATSVNADKQATAIVDKDGVASALTLNTAVLTASGTKRLADGGNYNGTLVVYLGGYSVLEEGEDWPVAGTVLGSFTYVVGPTVGYWVAPMIAGTGNLPFSATHASSPGDSMGGYGNLVGETESTQMGGLHLIVPEPMTIALLGLGGLFLRRRSKKQQTA